MAAELDVSISSQQATAGANELIRVCNQIIDAVKKVDSTLTAGQQQIDKFGDSFSSESKEIKTAVAEMSLALSKSLRAILSPVVKRKKKAQAGLLGTSRNCRT